MPKTRVDPIIESVTLEPELEEALSSATDAELCDIAGNQTYPDTPRGAVNRTPGDIHSFHFHFTICIFQKEQSMCHLLFHFSVFKHCFIILT